jgi:hypothetical protein
MLKSPLELYAKCWYTFEEFVIQGKLYSVFYGVTKCAESSVVNNEKIVTLTWSLVVVQEAG